MAEGAPSSLQASPYHSAPTSWLVHANHSSTAPPAPVASSGSSAAMRLATLLDTAPVPLTTSFNTLCIALATLWLIYRAYLVVNKPLDELVNLLGFEIPQEPHLDLAAVKADGAILHWKPADDRRTSHRYEVQVNGSTVGELLHSENSIILSNLQPNHLYVIRIVVVNSLDFRAASEPVRISTKPSASADYFDASIASLPDDQATVSSRAAPIVRPFKPFPDSLSVPAVAPPMVRETSNGPAQSRRIVSARRPSPAVDVSNLPPEPGVDESQQCLMEKLEEVGRDTAELDKQMQDEEQEAVTTKADLVQERDELRLSLKDKENTSRDLKKQVGVLERENTAIQSRKAAQDRALQLKSSERQKLKDDSARWEREILDMQDAVVRIGQDKHDLLQDIEKEREALQEKQALEVQALRALEDEIKEKSGWVKRLEREKSNSPINAESNENEGLFAQEAEEDRVWNDRVQYLDERYKAVWAEMDAAKRLCQDAYVQQRAVQQRQFELSHMAPSMPAFEQQTVSRGNSIQHRRPQPGPVPMAAPSRSSQGFSSAADQSFSNGLHSNAQSFQPSISPFFNFNNGMTLEMPTNGSFSNSDLERLSAPMSPGIGAALLPAGLLSTVDEDMMSNSASVSHQRDGENNDADVMGRQQSSTQMLPGLGAFSSSNFLPGLGAPQTQNRTQTPVQQTTQIPDNSGQGPISPSSPESRSPSVFASPGASASNLAFQSPDFESDRRSIRSARSVRVSSSGAMQSGSRFSQILGLDRINRPREKAVSDDGPAFGTLTKSQSQSMPRDGAEDEQNGPHKRRNSTHAGNFFGNVLNRSSAVSKSTDADDATTQKTIAVRRRPFHVFGSRQDGWPAVLGGEIRPVSPRPVSTHSTELPRPSQDSSSWGVWPSSEAFGQRSSPLSADWGQPQPGTIGQGRARPSRHPSRRPSAQYGGPGNVSYDIMEDEDDDSDTYDDAPTQAPIGTKPTQGFQRPPSPRLNPAAKDFKSLFSFGDKMGKGERLSRRQRKDNADASDENLLSNGGSGSGSASMLIGSPVGLTGGLSVDHGSTAAHAIGEENSPPGSRVSRDTRSITTADSSTTHEYSSRNSLDRTPSHTAQSDALTPSSVATTSAGRESFMAKLSRKSSSGKFSLPVFSRSSEKKAAAAAAQRSDKGRDGAPPAVSLDEDREGEGVDGDLGRSLDSIPRGGAGRSWSHMFSGSMRKGKERSGEEAPSISEASLTSETTGDGEDDGEE